MEEDEYKSRVFSKVHSIGSGWLCLILSPSLVWERVRRTLSKGSLCLAFRQKGKGCGGVVFSAFDTS